MNTLLEKLRNERTETTLGEVVTFHRGYDLPVNDIKQGKFPVVFSNGRKEYHDAFKVRGPGVYTGRSGSLGGIFYIEENYWPHNTTLFVSDFHGNDPKFCYYFLQSFNFSKFNAGTGVPTLNRNHIHGILVKIPDFPTQKKIAEILGAYDAKIENNNTIIKNLEATAQAIFNEWFVKFNFPVELVKSEKLRVNNGGKLGYKDAGGKMVNSELGLIPEGWGVKSLDEVCDASIGRTPPREEHRWFSRNKNDIKWISIKDLGSSGIFIFDTEEKLTKEAVKKFNISIIPKNTVIVSFKLTIGRVAVTTEEMLSNEAIAHLKIKEENSISRQYLYLFMKGYDYYSLASTSSIANAVNSKTIKSIKLVVPPPTLIKSFDVVNEPIFNSLLSIQQENILLKVSRDQLLKKLI